jgi:carboxyl-terminal processing protease
MRKNIKPSSIARAMHHCVLALAFGASASFGAHALNSDATAVARNLDIFNALIRELQLSYVDSIDAKKTVEDAMLYMLDAIDPYTTYYSADNVEELSSISSGEYGGVGSLIGKRRDGRVAFTEPLENSPAYQAGVRGGDIIRVVGTDTIRPGTELADVTAKLKGTPGTTVKVEVTRPYAQADSLLTFNILRSKIATPAVSYYGTTGADGRVGYIYLSSFTDSAPEEVRQAVEDMIKNKKITSLVLDLQENPGGLLESAVDIVGLFVPKGTEVLRTRGREADSEKIYRTSRAPIAEKMPLAVLIDGYSASSAEIVAGSLQDLDRAVIVGERSFGKGLVQSSRSLPYDGVLKLTVAKYYIPSGRLIQAIDYSRRNDDGSVARTPDSLTHVYHTLHGREVRDGGGITPDSVVKSPAGNRLLYNIRRDGWDTEFATRYASQHPTIPPVGEFEITDSIFADFKRGINPDEFNYDRATTTALSALRTTARNEGYMNDAVEQQLDSLEQLLHHDLNQDLDLNRDVLNQILSDAIVRRYYFQRGGVENSMRFNPQLIEAVKILETPKVYQSILEAKRTN